MTTKPYPDEPGTEPVNQLTENDRDLIARALVLAIHTKNEVLRMQHGIQSREEAEAIETSKQQYLTLLGKIR